MKKKYFQVSEYTCSVILCSGACLTAAVHPLSCESHHKVSCHGSTCLPINCIQLFQQKCTAKMFIRPLDQLKAIFLASERSAKSVIFTTINKISASIHKKSKDSWLYMLLYQFLSHVHIQTFISSSGDRSIQTPRLVLTLLEEYPIN